MENPIAREADTEGAMKAAAGRRRYRRRRLAFYLLLGLGVFAGVLLKVGVDPLLAAARGVVGFVQKGFAFDPSPPRRPADPAPLPDALAALPPSLRDALIAPEAEIKQQFRFQLGVAPAEICAAIKAAGLRNGGWKSFGDAFFECMSELVPIAVATSPDLDSKERERKPSTLFFVMRGPTEKEIGFIRFKLNLDDSRAEARGRDQLYDLLKKVARFLAWTPPPELEKAIREQTKLFMVHHGIAISVHPENDGVERLNVVLELASPAARLPSDRFVGLPPFPPEMAPPPVPPAPGPFRPSLMPEGLVEMDIPPLSEGGLLLDEPIPHEPF